MNWRSRSALTAFVLLVNLTLAMSQTRSLPPSERFVGGVYVMSNDADNNEIIAFGRRSDGIIEPMGNFSTGGKGSSIDDGQGLFTLFSALSVKLTPDNRFLIAANPGSSSISVFRVLPDFRLCLRSVRRVAGFGPVSVAFSKGVVYAASAHAERTLPPGFTDFSLQGALTGFKLTKGGKLRRIRNSVRRLPNRPASIEFSPDGRTLIVASPSAGATDLNTTRADEVYTFRVFKSGRLSKKFIDSATSTLPNNEEGRSIPGAIEQQSVRVGGSQYVVVSEARFSSSNGTGIDEQVGSISTWRLTSKQTLIPEQMDVLAGTSPVLGELASCWLEFSKNKEYFWVSNSVSGSISTFSFKDGKVALVEEVAGLTPGAIDLWVSSDGRFLYQLGFGFLDVFEIEDEGFGPGLTEIQSIEGIPTPSAVGIVAI